MRPRASLFLPLAGLNVAFCLPLQASAVSEQYSPPAALLAGYARTFKLDASLKLHLAIELEPKDRTLDAAALAAGDPASPTHRTPLDAAQFVERYGRSQADVDALAALLRTNGATNVYASSNRLVVGGDLTIKQAEATLHTRYDLWEKGTRSVVAPTTPLTLPVTGIRAVRGAVKQYTPRLAANAPGLPTDLRGSWYPPAQFRQAYDAVPDGGDGSRIVLLEDSSDRAALGDLGPFAHGAGSEVPGTGADAAAPADAVALDPSHVSERVVTSPTNEQICGRDDRGQEPTMDVDAALTLAPKATIELRYDEICIRGGEGVTELQHALDDVPAPDVIVFPFAVAPLYGPAADTIGPTPIPYLEAALRGIAIVVPSGDDGAYGIRVPGTETPAVVYPCALPEVICAGGTQLGERPRTGFDEGPWNDGAHASGGGISHDPRPAWQKTPNADFAIRAYVKTRAVPDVSADASGHLFIFWHGYGTGGVGGTSEAAAIVGAQIAAIDAAVPKAKRIVGPGDLYALAVAAPNAFRHVKGKNDRGFDDNTMHPQASPLPLGYHGVLAPPPPAMKGCAGIQPSGCQVLDGYNFVTGLGSLKESAAISALQSPSPSP